MQHAQHGGSVGISVQTLKQTHLHACYDDVEALVFEKTTEPADEAVRVKKHHVLSHQRRAFALWCVHHVPVYDVPIDPLELAPVHQPRRRLPARQRLCRLEPQQAGVADSPHCIAAAEEPQSDDFVPRGIHHGCSDAPLQLRDVVCVPEWGGRGDTETEKGA